VVNPPVELFGFRLRAPINQVVEPTLGNQGHRLSKVAIAPGRKECALGLTRRNIVAVDHLVLTRVEHADHIGRLPIPEVVGQLLTEEPRHSIPLDDAEREPLELREPAPTESAGSYARLPLAYDVMGSTGA